MIQKFKYRKYLSMIQRFFKVEFKIRLYPKIPLHKISCSISLQSQNPCRVQNPQNLKIPLVKIPAGYKIPSHSISLQSQNLCRVQNPQNLKIPSVKVSSGYKIPSHKMSSVYKIPSRKILLDTKSLPK